ncbi:MAG: type II toxin-antitoxin system VapC family toxin [Candidatus Riflebacteria bacterium]|nr:type II toxin-antitoxin system VapC family toxin [Candidatus Riflebacteria bacterium]
MIVVDTNIISYFWIPGECTDQVKELFHIDPNWISVPLWRVEMQNVLAKYFRAKMMPEERAIELMALAEHQMSGHEFAVSSKDVLDLLIKSKCTSYDCQFIALAEMNKIPLLTTDEPLIKAFPKIAIHPKRYVKMKDAS